MSEPLPPRPPSGSPDSYSGGEPRATPALIAMLRSRIAAQGALSFADFMNLALYHPELGYYANGAAAVGKAGDFFTSVSVGPLFGRLLAERFLRWWRENDRPSPWRLVEVGAHDGTLAVDVLTALRELDPEAFAAVEYAIPEPLPALAERQWERLGSRFPGIFRHSTLRDLADHPLPGIVFANELIDALPFHVIRHSDRHWRERRVGLDTEGALIWQDAPISDPALERFCRELGNDLPENYTTEARPDLVPFLREMAATIRHGLVLLIDYGFARADYYHPSRTAGTLRTFSRHRAGDDPLDAPGSRDITAHVDFTGLMRAGEAAGLEPHLWADQSRYLTELARSWLVSLEAVSQAERAPLLRQFQTLTHPAHLGAKFHVLEMIRPPSSAGFSLPNRPGARELLEH